jgi:hypothetical protein
MTFVEPAFSLDQQVVARAEGRSQHKRQPSNHIRVCNFSEGR